MKFDLLVIGAGSGLSVVSAAAARGMKVALVEEGPMGGTCLNRGCIPTKILIHSADVLQAIRKAHLFGINVKGSAEVDFEKAMERSWQVDEDAAKIEENLRSARNITLFKGRGRFVGKKVLEVNGERISADKIVIASGTRPGVPNIEGLDRVPYMTSREILRIRKLPKELAIIGGGYVAVELAHFFSSAGSKVTILQRNAKLLPREDEEISRKFTELFSKQCSVELGFRAVKIEDKGGRIVVRGDDGRKAECTDLLVATGVTPNTDILAIEKTGVKTRRGGYVEVNGYMETNVEGIWALGDIAGVYLFKHSANLEAGYVIHNMFNPEDKMEVDYRAMPHAVFSNPQIAGVGATEQELRDKGIKYLAGTYEYAKTGMGTALAEKDGVVKFLTDYKGKLLGCHILGPEASTLIHEVIVIMRKDGSISDISNAVHIHPALSEVVERAARSV